MFTPYFFSITRYPASISPREAFLPPTKATSSIPASSIRMTSLASGRASFAFRESWRAWRLPFIAEVYLFFFLSQASGQAFRRGFRGPILSYQQRGGVALRGSSRRPTGRAGAPREHARTRPEQRSISDRPLS